MKEKKGAWKKIKISRKKKKKMKREEDGGCQGQNWKSRKALFKKEPLTCIPP